VIACGRGAAGVRRRRCAILDTVTETTLREAWAGLRAQVEQRFAAMPAEAALTRQAAAFLDEWLTHPLYREQQDAILQHVQAGQFDLLLDSFYQMVPFGTGGRRGRVGFGPNRINPVTVAMSVEGHCRFLREHGAASGSPQVVVAFDTRVFQDVSKTYAFLAGPNPLLGLTSRALGRIAAGIYAANGFEVYLAGLDAEDQYLSTPELSFAIRHLGALAGMNVSASHNHPDDNGFKFFNSQGAQDIPPTDQTMASYMGRVEEVRSMPLEEARARGKVRALPGELHRAYVRLNLDLRSRQTPPVTVVYTPLCGVGDTTVGDVLRAAGHRVHIYGPHNTRDGTFAAVPFRLPNPEVPEAAAPAIALAQETGADMILSTDPDADRIGVFARDTRGRWRYFTGDQIAAILAYYLCLDPAGPRRRGVLIKTLVTSRMIERIAQRAGCSLAPDLLVGFKYIAHVLHALETEGRYGEVAASHLDLVLAAEESHGVLLTPGIRDKDAAGGAVILCELLAGLQARGQSLPEYLDALSAACGNYHNVSRSIVMRGIQGVKNLADMMRSLRAAPPAAFGGMPVLHATDLLDPQHGPLRSESERLSRNMLIYELEAARVVIRPSGTEPKAKVYVDLEGEKAGAAGRARGAEMARTLAEAVLADCIGRIGYRLSPSALLLPDAVDLELKRSFDASFRADLAAQAAWFATQPPAGQLAWLRKRLEKFGSGADPIEATRAALVHLLGDLALESPAPAGETWRSLAAAVEDAVPPTAWVT
jgi:phosphoglucomutase